MTPSLKIYKKVLNRLSESQENEGNLYGILAKNSLTIIGFHVGDDESNLVSSFPAEVDIYGIVKVGHTSDQQQIIIKKLSLIDVTDNPVFLNYDINTKQIDASFYINGQLELAKYTIVSEQDILSQFLFVRLQAQVPLHCCHVGPESIAEAFLNLRKSISSGVMAFNFTKTNIYLLGSDDENGVIGISGNPGIGELCEDSNDLSEGIGRKKKMQNFGIDVLNINMLKRSTGENGMGNFKNHAPVCVLDKKQNRRLSAVIALDTLSMLNRQAKVVNLYHIFVESAMKNLKLFESAFLKFAVNNQLENGIAIPESLHFYPDQCGHFITRVYFQSEADNTLTEERVALHNKLILPLNRPMFRKSNSFAFKTGIQNNEPLSNPHEAVKNTDNGGKVSLVKGKYFYYHYCQNKMDDNGWGCAYRSLQTLASWFKIQGYTNANVPSFSDIQKCLVDIGDKPKSFIDSKQWIGSTEVSFVLNTLLNVTCKILYVSSGEEMATKGPELVNHFDQHGSPVMIGGGVLAHTILGVDYNNQTGNLKFLILDPHYTGSEDLHTIINKGWCGWKGVDFWDKTAYYNMCLPQVPVEV